MEQISGSVPTEGTESMEKHTGCPGCRTRKTTAGNLSEKVDRTGILPEGKEQSSELSAGEGRTQEHPGEDESMECGCRLKHRENEEYRNLMNRLKRIEGQIRGIQGMVEEERYCVDILTQVMAVQSALNSFNKALLSNHIKTCVVDDIREGNHAAVDELCSTIQKLMK